MTLNINLEDVPDAILEAVKARIMANRRRLLDRQELLRQPPLQPKPQSRKFGADSKRWKRPQPAAVANYGLGCDGVFIYFPSTAPPLANDEGAVITREASAIEPYSIVEGDGFTAYTIDVEEIVTTFLQEAWNVDFGETEIDASTGEFTVQYLVKQEGSTGTVRIELFNGSTLPANTRFDITTYSTFILASQDGVNYDFLNIANNSPSYVHYAIQKISGNKITVHRNGQKIYDESTSASSPDILRFRLLRDASTGVAISPIRIQDRAVYGDAETIEPLPYPFCRPLKSLILKPAA
jgi:hypothetical protein